MVLGRKKRQGTQKVPGGKRRKKNTIGRSKPHLSQRGKSELIREGSLLPKVSAIGRNDCTKRQREAAIMGVLMNIVKGNLIDLRGAGTCSGGSHQASNTTR